MVISGKRIGILSLTSALMLTSFSLTGCGKSAEVDPGMDAEQTKAPESEPAEEPLNEPETEPEEVADIAAGTDMEENTVYLDSFATRGPGYISVNETFTDQKGNQYNLFMCGLKEENKDAMLQALSQYYDPDSEEGLTIYDDAFADAEKYDNHADSDVDSYDDSYDELDNDSAQCWAAAVSNALWVNGWAEKLQNPITGNTFSSEDDIFRYYNRKITNEGAETKAGVDFFFMGEFYETPDANRTGGIAGLLDLASPEDGLMKDFFSSNLVTEYDLTTEPDGIEALKHCGNKGGDATDFVAAIGPLGWEGELSISMHDVSAIGVITDPNADGIEESMKAILIVDSDNDAKPSEADGTGENLTLELRDEAKEARPNSVTVYNLQLSKDAYDVPYWMMKGYIMDEDNPSAVLYGLSEIPGYSEDIIAASTETEGTKTAYDSIDIAPEILFTTGETEAIGYFFGFTPEDVTVNEFSSGDPVNLNFLVANRGGVVLDEDYLKGKELIADWSVVRDDDGSVVAKDKYVIGDSIYFGEVNGYLITLNQEGDKVAAWDPGDYTVTLDLNVDRSVPEAYFLNNVQKEYHFTIK